MDSYSRIPDPLGLTIASYEQRTFYIPCIDYLGDGIDLTNLTLNFVVADITGDNVDRDVTIAKNGSTAEVTLLSQFPGVLYSWYLYGDDVIIARGTLTVINAPGTLLLLPTHTISATGYTKVGMDPPGDYHEYLDVNPEQVTAADDAKYIYTGTESQQCRFGFRDIESEEQRDYQLELLLRLRGRTHVKNILSISPGANFGANPPQESVDLALAPIAEWGYGLDKGLEWRTFRCQNVQWQIKDWLDAWWNNLVITLSWSEVEGGDGICFGALAARLIPI